jgi:hypothetical protein
MPTSAYGICAKAFGSAAPCHDDVMSLGQTGNQINRSRAMNAFWSLFSPRPQYRHYAHVDQSGICCAFKHSSQPPAGREWVEISEQNLAWLGQPLPTSARRVKRPTQPAGRQLHIA